MTCPNASGNWVAEPISLHSPGLRSGELHRRVVILTVASRWPNGGETQGLVATADGDFAAAVINGTSGVMQVWFERIARDNLKRYQAVREDLSVDANPDLRLNAQHAVLDMRRRRMSVDVDIENVSRQVVNGPFALVLQSLRSGMKGVQVVNADNGNPGVGAEWDFSTPGPSPSLGANAHTNARTLELECAQLVTDSGIEPAAMDLMIVRKP